MQKQLLSFLAERISKFFTCGKIILVKKIKLYKKYFEINFLFNKVKIKNDKQKI